MLAYNCSPSFNWRAHLDDATIAKFQKELGAMGYRFQFITLAGLPRAERVDVRAGPRVRAG
jgi:isocitrate lyase